MTIEEYKNLRQTREEAIAVLPNTHRLITNLRQGLLQSNTSFENPFKVITRILVNESPQDIKQVVEISLSYYLSIINTTDDGEASNCLEFLLSNSSIIQRFDQVVGENLELLDRIISELNDSKLTEN